MTIDLYTMLTGLAIVPNPPAEKGEREMQQPTGKISRPPAEIYDEFFVPALFQQWGSIVSEVADIRPGQRVLDVACGTGVLACAAAERVAPDGHVTGLDINPEMLEVARRKDTPVDWRLGPAEGIPFPDGSFDAVVSQFGFTFFDDRVTALKEMMRVLKPGGTLAVAVCDGLDHSPGYAVLAELLHRLFGPDVAQAFRAPFILGDRDQLLAIASEAEVPDARVIRRDGTVQFPSIASLVSTERACVWTLGGLLDDHQFERLNHAAQESFEPFATASGDVIFDMPSLILTARKP